MPEPQDSIDHFTCPNCSSTMKVIKKSYRIGGLNVGSYEAVTCKVCGKHFFTDNGLRDIISDYENLRKSKIIDLTPKAIVAQTYTKNTQSSTMSQTLARIDQVEWIPLIYDPNSIHLSEPTPESFYQNDLEMPDV